MITLDTQRQWNNAFNILRTFSLNFQPRILYLAKIFKSIDRIKEFLDTQGYKKLLLIHPLWKRYWSLYSRKPKYGLNQENILEYGTLKSQRQKVMWKG